MSNKRGLTSHKSRYYLSTEKEKDMNVYEKLWGHYTENTDLDLSDKGGVYDLMYNAEGVGVGIGTGIAVNLRTLDRHYGYDYECVYGKDTIALFETHDLLGDVLSRAVSDKKLEPFLDDVFPEWREEWEIPNQDAGRYLSVDDLLSEFEFADRALETFMGMFGYFRFSTTSDLWEDPSYVSPIYDDPNQLKLPFETV